MTMFLRLVAVLCWLLVAPAQAGEVRMQLNWAPGADHAPLYYAMQQGWFQDQGVALQVTPGGGSAFTLDAITRGEFDLGIVDLLTAMRGRAKGKDTIAVMSIFVNAPHAFYWLKESGIASLADLPGKRLGALPDDPARKLWRALAKRNGIDPDSIRWVDLAHNMKVEALADGRIDVATNPFFHNHAGYEAAFGDRLVEMPWRDLGFNPYSNSIVARRDFATAHADDVRAVTRTLQRAIRFCLATPAPCLDALLKANDFLEPDQTRRNWAMVESLLRPLSPGATIGAFDARRLARDYNMLLEEFGVDRAFDPALWAVNDYLDPTIRLQD